MLTPLTSFTDIRWKKYVNWSSMWMIFTALATVVYSLSDKVAAEVLPQGPVNAAKYGYFLLLIAFLFYRGFWHWLPGETKDSQKIKRSEVLMGAVLNYACYWMVLWAYQLVGQASYIVAFRQFSIVLGVVAAFVIYKERGLRVRIAAAAIITGGLVMIGLWG
jgi:drug/metabolite transporter (DMT)-like permease